jgi:hypothetical protein
VSEEKCTSTSSTDVKDGQEGRMVPIIETRDGQVQCFREMALGLSMV